MVAISPASDRLEYGLNGPTRFLKTVDNFMQFPADSHGFALSKVLVAGVVLFYLSRVTFGREEIPDQTETK